MVAGKGKWDWLEKLFQLIPDDVKERGMVDSFTWLFTNGIDLIKDNSDSNSLTESERLQVKALLKTHNIEIDLDPYTHESTLLEAIGKDMQDYLTNPDIAFHSKKSLVEGLDAILDSKVSNAGFIGEG